MDGRANRVVVRKLNSLPRDEFVERIGTAGGAAFGVTDPGGSQRLVVVQEVDLRRAPDLEEVASAIRRAVQEENELHVHALVLLGPGAWSLDARLFGWKRIHIKDRQAHEGESGPTR